MAIPFRHLVNKARQTECPECGSTISVEAEPEIDGVRCVRCGWELSLLDGEEEAEQ